jgi:thymidylate kinase
MTSGRAAYRLPVVELAGPAGSGKTTVAAHLMQTDETFGPGRLHIPLHRFVLDACRLLPTFARMRGTRADIQRKDVKRMLYLSAMSRTVERARRSGSYRVLLLDEGPVYMLARMRALAGAIESSGYRKWVQNALEWWGRELDVVALLDAPNEVLVQRIRGRSDPPPVARLTDHELSRFLTRYRAVYEQIVGELAQSGPVRVVRIATDGVPPAIVAHRIRGIFSPAAFAV